MAKAHKTVKAILFDHDGTLIDSESVHLSLWQQVVAQFDVELSEAFYNQTMAGIPVAQNALDLVAHFSLPTTPEQLANNKQALTAEYLKHQAFPLMAGADEVLHACDRAGIRLAIVTGGMGMSVARTLEAYGFESLIEVVVAVEDVVHSKPAPDCYLQALEQMNLSAADVVAIEDTAHGLQAAAAAGITCDVIPTAMSAQQDFSLARGQYASLQEWAGTILAG